ncbi:type VII secretion protein EssA [Oceanobacillus halophilus]|uniref:Type VII secretion protein EssA n=2 Tax=Oceanobacillus halophilus TaxID=930130 RepID=A0A495A3Y1_9BACI|nr:type VII secretion protein EssA [Oceanobacillus halophilus]
MIMKKRLLSNIVLIIILMVGSPVLADDSTIKVEPNIYKGKDININRNFQETEQKKPLPEEQKNLTFEKENKTETDRIEEQLFLSSNIETNTIAAKAQQFNLFSEQDKRAIQLTDEAESVQNNSTIMILMIIAVSLVIGTMFFFIIPRMKQTYN